MKRAKFASCSALREPGNEVTILNTVFTVRTGRDLVTSPDKKIPGFSVHTIPDSKRT